MTTRIFEIHVVDAAEPADVATLRRERDEAVQAVHEWRDAGASCQAELSATVEELATARAENERLRGELAKVSASRDCYLNQAKNFSRSVAERCAERDEARKALAEMRADDPIDAGRGQWNALVDRVRDLKAQLAAQIEKTNECTRALNAYPGVAELASLRARVAELEATVETRDKRVEYLSSSIHAIQSLVDSV